MSTLVWLKKSVLFFGIYLCMHGSLAFSQSENLSKHIDNKTFNPGSVLWYQSPAKKWEEAMPVGNGRLGAMVFGKHGEERIQLNEETLWSGGPYSSVVKGGAKVLPKIQ
jgi:alpha-L-fucosidase 2